MFTNPTANSMTLGLAVMAAALALAACDKRETATPAADAAIAADSVRADELAAKERALAQREAELVAKEQEAARLQAEADAQQKAEADAKAAAKKPAPRRSAAAPAQNITAANATPAQPVEKRVEVPIGTQLTVALASALSSKSAKPGDPFEASLVSDLTIEDRLALPAGSRVTGTVTDVVSGSRAIGAVPMLGLRFDRLELDDGQKIKISGELVEQGRSEKGRDTAKILGGAAAGAVLGHQVKKGDSGRVIGGLLGGAIGAVAAKKTGTEVQLAAGSTLTITIGEAFKVVTH